MPESEVDLSTLFNTVAKTLKTNQVSLNEADSFNHDHGDNMVKNFKVISKALKQKQGASPSEQLAYASEVLRKSSNSGSARLYSDGLSRAADQFQGQRSISPNTALTLVQALMGGQPAAQPPEPQPTDMLGGLMGALLGGGTSAPPAAQPAQDQSADMLGGLMDALLGGGQSAPAQPAQAQSTDMLGGLMGALLGGEAGGSSSQSTQAGQAAGGIDLNTLLTAGAAYLQAKQQGASPMEGIMAAILAGSQMNTTPHHSQSSQLVVSTLINTISNMMSGKK